MKKAPAELSHVPDPIRLSTSHWFEFETEALSLQENLESLNQIKQDLLVQLTASDLPQRVLLEIDGQTPVYGENELGSCKAEADPIPDQRFLRFNGEGEVVPEDGAIARPEICEPMEERGVVLAFATDTGPVPEPSNDDAVYVACGAVTEAGKALPVLSPPTGKVIATTQRPKLVRSHKLWWIAVAAVVAALGIVWIAYGNRRSAPPSGAEQRKTNFTEQQSPFISAKQLPTNSTPTLRAAPVAAEAKAVKTRRRRVRVRGNEVDIGEDVTVRYLTPQQAIVPPRTVSSGLQAADSSLPQPKMSTSPKLAQ